MTSKERFQKACQYDFPDRPPMIPLSAQTMVWEKLYRAYEISIPGGFLPPDTPGFRYEGLDTTAHESFMCKVSEDFRRIEPKYIGPVLKTTEDGCWEGIWGEMNQWRRASDAYYAESVYLPYAGIDDIDTIQKLRFPSPDWYDYSGISDLCSRYEGFALVTGSAGSVDFINGTAFSRGVQQVLEDIALEDPVYLYIVQKRFEFYYEKIRRILEAANGAIDLVFVGDDLGTQVGPIINPKSFEKLLAPYYAKLFQMVHGFGAKTRMHSCGSVSKFIPIMIEMGLDILDAVQVDAVDMDIESLHARYYGKIMFSGSLSVQSLLPTKFPEQIVNEITKRKKLFSAGGILLGPSNIMQVDMPVENFKLMVEEIHRVI